MLAFVLATLACTGTDGDVLRTRRTAGAGGGPDGGSMEPPSGRLSSWQIQLSGALDTSLDVEIYVTDLTTPSAVIQQLKSEGRTVICYFSAGTREPFRDDAERFPEGALGARLPDYPEERYVDVRDASVRSIMRTRLEAAKIKGCDGIHPSGLAAFLAPTELDFARSDQVAYDRWLAGVTHELDLTIGLVDGDANLSEELAGDFDWIVVWTCLGTRCASASPFLTRGKPAFLVEYGDETRAAEVCPAAKALGLSAIIKRDADLDAFRVGCP